MNLLVWIDYYVDCAMSIHTIFIVKPKNMIQTKILIHQSMHGLFDFNCNVSYHGLSAWKRSERGRGGMDGTSPNSLSLAGGVGRARASGPKGWEVQTAPDAFSFPANVPALIQLLSSQRITSKSDSLYILLISFSVCLTSQRLLYEWSDV